VIKFEILSNLITRPYLFYHLLWPSPKWEYLFRLLAPLAFLPLLGWRYTIGALLVWAQNSFTNYLPMHSIHFQYTAEIVPFLWVGAAAGLQRIREGSKDRKAKSIQWLLAASALSLLLAESSEMARALRIPVTPREDRIVEALNRLPPKEAISAQFHLLPQVSTRPVVYLFPRIQGQTQAEFVVLDTARDVPSWNSTQEQFQRAIIELEEKGYHKMEGFDGFQIYQRLEPAPEKAGETRPP
jgi:uncharacterized membrane protein